MQSINGQNCGKVNEAREDSAAATLMGHLTGAQGDVHGAISRLEDRLSAVLTPEACKVAASAPQELCDPVTSPLCGELGRRLETENSAYRRIHALIDRLTV